MRASLIVAIASHGRHVCTESNHDGDAVIIGASSMSKKSDGKMQNLEQDGDAVIIGASSMSQLQSNLKVCCVGEEV